MSENPEMPVQPEDPEELDEEHEQAEPSAESANAAREIEEMLSGDQALAATLPKAVEHHEIPDGLRAWQAAIVRLWSASDDSFATLALTRVPDGTEGAPWTATLHCGEEGDEPWSEDVKITGAKTIQLALQRLWDRAKVRHGLFEDEAERQPLPSDFPADSWLTTAERALIDHLTTTMKTRQSRPVALRLSYHPDLGLESRWAATLHDPAQTFPEGTFVTLQGAHLANVCEALIKEIDR